MTLTALQSILSDNYLTGHVAGVRHAKKVRLSPGTLISLCSSLCKVLRSTLLTNFGTRATLKGRQIQTRTAFIVRSGIAVDAR
jgi:hypothetical protein